MTDAERILDFFKKSGLTEKIQKQRQADLISSVSDHHIDTPPLGLLYRNQQSAAAVSRIYTVSQGDGNFAHLTAGRFLLPCHHDASAGF